MLPWDKTIQKYSNFVQSLLPSFKTKISSIFLFCFCVLVLSGYSISRLNNYDEQNIRPVAKKFLQRVLLDGTPIIGLLPRSTIFRLLVCYLFLAIISISTLAPKGKEATPIVVLAG